MNARRQTVLDELQQLLAGATAWSTPEALALLDNLSDMGLLRRLDAAMAHFVAGHDAAAEPALLMATALLVQMEGRGHTCLPLQHVADAPNQILAWPAEREPLLASVWRFLPATLDGWLQALQRSPLVRVCGRDADAGQPLVLSGVDGDAPLLYLRRYWHYESTVARHIAQRTGAQWAHQPADPARLRAWLDRLFGPASAAAEGAGGQAINWQKMACALALQGGLSIITGGPGTGKTYTAARLLALLFAMAPDAQKLRVALAAPTGKAAARLKQSIDKSLDELPADVQSELQLQTLVQRMGPASTVHSLLGAQQGTRHWRHHAGNVLDVDVLIVDEASMVNLEMMASLLEALPASARLVLLGDKDQLASVEAGAVLGDLCQGTQEGGYSQATAAYVAQVTGDVVPASFVVQGAGHALPQHTTMLRESRRFKYEIKELALRVNQPAQYGASDDAQAWLDAYTRQGPHAELYAHAGGAATRVAQEAVQGRGPWPGYRLYAELLQKRPENCSVEEHETWVREVLDAFDRFRLLCAVREGDWGVEGLNRAVARELTRCNLLRAEGEWYRGRPVMVTRNDKQLGVSNGDIGIALPSHGNPQQLRVYFAQGSKVHHVSTSRLAQVETAFAMTVHKSQGSEFTHTALVLSSQGGSVQGRELVYTGITRAREAFTLWSQAPGLLTAAIASPTRRSSGLLRFL